MKLNLNLLMKRQKRISENSLIVVPVCIFYAVFSLLSGILITHSIAQSYFFVFNERPASLSFQEAIILWTVSSGLALFINLKFLNISLKWVVGKLCTFKQKLFPE